MKNENFQKRIRDFAAADGEYNIDLFNLIKEKHEQLVKEDPDYLTSTEHHFLSELLNPVGDPQLRSYFRDELRSSDPVPWKKSPWFKMSQFFKK